MSTLCNIEHNTLKYFSKIYSIYCACRLYIEISNKNTLSIYFRYIYIP